MNNTFPHLIFYGMKLYTIEEVRNPSVDDYNLFKGHCHRPFTSTYEEWSEKIKNSNESNRNHEQSLIDEKGYRLSIGKFAVGNVEERDARLKEIEDNPDYMTIEELGELTAKTLE